MSRGYRGHHDPDGDRHGGVPTFPWGRAALYIEPRDLWAGAYVAPTAVYLCPLPAVVWTRRTTPPASAAPTTRRSTA